MDDGAGASALDDSMLTEEEKESVEAFFRDKSISRTRRCYSATARAPRRRWPISRKLLANVRTQDLGEVGDLIAGVVTELREFDATEEKGLFGFFKKRERTKSRACETATTKPKRTSTGSSRRFKIIR